MEVACFLLRIAQLKTSDRRKDGRVAMRRIAVVARRYSLPTYTTSIIPPASMTPVDVRVVADWTLATNGATLFNSWVTRWS